MSNQNGYWRYSNNVPTIQLQESQLMLLLIHNYTNKRFKNDVATITLDTHQSIGVGAYQLDNMYEIKWECKRSKISTAINFNGGKGWIGEKGCLIDNDSNLNFVPLI